MGDSGLSVETSLPFSWATGTAAAGIRRGGKHLLKVANLLDAHDPEPDKGEERLEAKLDLMLHWLGRQLFGEYDSLPPATLHLGMDFIDWTEAGTPLARQDATLSLVIHPDLPSPLQLPARVTRDEAGHCHAELQFQDEETSDAWGRWLFRLHRRAVQEARNRADSA